MLAVGENTYYADVMTYRQGTSRIQKDTANDTDETDFTRRVTNKLEALGHTIDWLAGKLNVDPRALAYQLATPGALTLHHARLISSILDLPMFRVYVDAVGLAEILQVTRDTVYRMVARDEIPYIKVGREYRFFPEDVTRHLANPKPSWAQSARSLGRRRKGLAA